MPATVVSFSVQTGSGGFAIARRVADRLGFRYYDWEITSEAAARAGVSPNEVIAAERVPSFLERMMRRLGAVSTVSLETGPGFGEPTPAMWSTAIQSFTSDDYRQLIERVVLELADRGEAVIVGHASQCLLRDRPGALRVLIHGSPEVRARRLAAEQGGDLEKAALLVKQSDKDRRELMKRTHHVDILSAELYDISLNTDRISLDLATETIVAAAQQLP